MRLAFCFHHSKASGASLWLRQLLMGLPPFPERALAVFPGESEMMTPLRAAGYDIDSVPLDQVSLRERGLMGAPALLAQRVAAVWRYRALFRRHRIGAVYVNSSVQSAPMLAAASLKLPLVVHVHEGWGSGPAFALKKAVIRRFARVALFASNEGMALFGGQPTGRRWVFSPNGVAPHTRDEARRSATRESLGMAPDRRMVLFLGSFIQRKGVHDLAEAWPCVRAEFPEAELVLAGLREETETHPAINRLLDGAIPGVRCLGFRRDAYALLEAADVFVLPSYGEALPLSICEAMMVGTPVVARGVGEVPWLLGEERGYLFHGKGPEPLESSLREALRGEDAAGRAGRAREFALAHLDEAQQRRQILDLLASLQS